MEKLKFWQRLCVAWSIIWNGMLPLEAVPNESWMYKIHSVLGDPHAVAMKHAFNKLKNEPKTYEGRLHLYSDGAGVAKREQVLEYAIAFLKSQGVKEISHWHLNFALEFLTGRDKGLL